MWSLLAKIDRLQNARLFKIIATAVVVLACAAAMVTYAIHVSRERENLPIQQVNEAELAKAVDSVTEGAPEGGDPGKASEAKKEAAKVLRENAETLTNSMNSIIEGRLDLWSMGFGLTAACAVLLIIVWLGIALTFLGIAGVISGICGPMVMYGSPWWQGVGLFVAAIASLAWCFVALMQSGRAALSFSNPVMAIAQNVISEAARMKVSLVFVVLLILALATLPGSLDSASPLRYRVQAFLVYGVEASFWLIALLVVFLSCATVAFEQRDKIIWQTMTKPVKHWQFVLGKWLGVMTVAAVLLGVSTGGTFLFTEYLHMQPAQGEMRAFVPADWQNESITQDRLILETQVLTARTGVSPEHPAFDPEAIAKAVEDKVKRLRSADPNFSDTMDTRKTIRDDILKELSARFMSVEPGQRAQFVFRGLAPAKEMSAPVTLRYKVNAGGNMPDQTYKVTLGPVGLPPMVLETRLDQTMTQSLPPNVIQMAKDEFGREDGILILDVWNGDVYKGIANRETMTFPAGGLEVSYPVSTFRANYFRAVVILWLKLAFLSIIGIGAATFLSFPVAALMAFGVLFCAEGAGFLAESLQSYDVMDGEKVVWWRYPIVYISNAVAWLFGFYVKLQPIKAISEGRVVTWLHVGTAITVLGGLTSVLWAISTAIFRKRELATYSGQ